MSQHKTKQARRNTPLIRFDAAAKIQSKTDLKRKLSEPSQRASFFVSRFGLNFCGNP